MCAGGGGDDECRWKLTLTKNDNGIGLQGGWGGVTEVEVGCFLKYLIIDMEAVRCCLTLEK